jgi:hypothetical protein
MPIDSVNSAMTPLQFARTHASSRSIETNAALSGRGGSGRSYGSRVVAAPENASTPPHRLLTPVAFHWSYTRTVVNGKPAAKRTPQCADTSYWSIAINRLG